MAGWHVDSHNQSCPTAQTSRVSTSAQMAVAVSNGRHDTAATSQLHTHPMTNRGGKAFSTMSTADVTDAAAAMRVSDVPAAQGMRDEAHKYLQSLL